MAKLYDLVNTSNLIYENNPTFPFDWESIRYSDLNIDSKNFTHSFYS
jgi:hypothetical protein